MEKQYTGLSRDVQELLQASGGEAFFHAHSDADEIQTDSQQEPINQWTVTFPEGTTTSECLLWTPHRRVYLLYSFPGGGSTALVEPKNESGPHRSLYLLSPEEQEKYGLSSSLETSGYPEISLRDDGVKEIVVPGQRRNGGSAIFLDGFGTGRPGFDLVYVLFTYHPSGKREIYLILPEEKNDASKRYAQLHTLMPEKAEHGVRTVMTALDYHLKESYGIDWGQELELLKVAHP